MLNSFLCRQYSQETLNAASAWVSALRAEGGTELLPALQAVLNWAVSASHPRQLLVLTDGEVANTEQIVALAKNLAGSTRIFAFGIGNSVDHNLVNVR